MAGERLARSTRILVSPISCWEVGMLVARGRVRLDRPTAAWVRDLFAGDRMTVADVTASVAVTAAELQGFQGDPTDRFLYATARCNGVPLVTKDHLIKRYAEVDGAVTTVW